MLPNRDGKRFRKRPNLLVGITGRQRRRLAHGRKLSPDGRFHRIVLVQRINQLTDNDRLLLGEIHQLGNVQHILLQGGQLVHTLLRARNGKTGLLKRVNITVKGTFGDADGLLDFLERIIRVA